MTFEQFKLEAPILKALAEEKYTHPTPIQEKAIPVALEGKDVLGSAQTGTGKTAAFSIPIIQHLLNRSNNTHHPKISTLIVTPTRELAIQIADSFSVYSKYTRIKNTVIFGGVGQGPQTDSLKKGVDVLIATPGRLLDLMSQGFVSLRDVNHFVLDEADRMLDMGFIHDIKKILQKLPKKRQSLFFSATMPQSIINLSREILTNPTQVAVDPVSSTADKIQQYLYTTNKSDKGKLLLHILKNPEIDHVLLFSRTKHGANKIAKNLQKKNIKAAAIHGDRSQSQRQKALNEFKDNKLRVLVATDIVARGIDIEKLKFVINYDIPNEAETYVHRIGRSGRAGEEGIAISICEPEENAYIRDIKKLIGKDIELVQDNPFPQTDKPMTEAEKKVFRKEKEERKRAFFANRNKKNNQNRKKSRSH